jgi:EAL domain-containing protein (putative c-di-GMP-specific phosphodiesterase class I)
VATFPDHAATVPQLLQAADGALYWAKRSGRNRIRVYDPRHVIALSLPEQRREVQALLASATPVAAVFQPMMEVATGRVAGYEALARFPAPFERPPHLWFAQAHRCGLGAVLEACAIRAALAVAERPAGTFLALNVSPAALLSPEVEGALPGDLDGIVIELTEHEAFDEDGALELALTELRARGARIALDDAGAGYAGLQQLIRVRPDIVKVDRSLVAGIHEDASKLALLEALAYFATTTGAAVCAEGIEELSELRALAGVDVTYAQGYALARPGPAWPVVPAAVAAEAASADHHGMRISRTAAVGAAQSLAEMTDVLAQARTLAELNRGLHGVTLQLGAQEAALSRVDLAAECLVTISDHDWLAAGERFQLADYPTTAHVIAEQAIGQVIAGDPASDPAELDVLATAGMRAVLLMPLIHEGAAIALLEIYRSTPQAWTNTQVDLARVLANHIAASLVRVTTSEPTDPRRAPARPQSAPR